jgi:tetratricopeptide (TPR) repeat protein
MARALRDEQVTPADELRALLTANEKLVVNLQDNRGAALELLENLDRLVELWPELEAAGVDLRPELGRWETLQASLRKQAPHLVRALRADGGLPALREKYHGDAEAAWWWYLAEETRARNRQRAFTVAMVIVGLVAVGAALNFLLGLLFPVDPALKAALSRLMAGQQKIEYGADYVGALADFQEAVALMPDDPDAWLWLGVTQQKLGEEAAAQESFGQARALLASELEFRLGRVPMYMVLQMPDEALADIEVVLSHDPDNARALYYLAGIFEAQERYGDAVAVLQRAAELADARQEVELTAITRYRLGLLLQQMQARSLAAPTPTPP